MNGNTEKVAVHVQTTQKYNTKHLSSWDRHHNSVIPCCWSRQFKPNPNPNRNPTSHIKYWTALTSSDLSKQIHWDISWNIYIQPAPHFSNPCISTEWAHTIIHLLLFKTGCVFVFLTLTVSVPVAPVGSRFVPPAHPETSAASCSGYETHPAGCTQTYKHICWIWYKNATIPLCIFGVNRLSAHFKT